MKNLLITFLLTFFLIFNANSGTDGVNEISKNKPKDVKDCFETLNRGTFALNQGLDKVIFKPVAKAYRILPSPLVTKMMCSADLSSSGRSLPPPGATSMR